MVIAHWHNNAKHRAYGTARNEKFVSGSLKLLFNQQIIIKNQNVILYSFSCQKVSGIVKLSANGIRKPCIDDAGGTIS
ncbi:MAG: hypothetical protein IJM09_00875 [Neisseriaceae bacterium]|nr:hypothetical protein [Neisseriaceae bacterium]